MLYICPEFAIYIYTPTEIIKSPQGKTVFLNQLGVFTCETYGDFSGWKVNGTSYIYLSQEIQDDLKTDQEGIGANKTLTLNVTARAMYNGTFVQCVTGRYGQNTVESEIVILTIQGIYRF